MAKKCASSVLDAALDKIATATKMLLLPSEPTDLAAATAAKLGELALSSGDFTKAAGDVSGRKVTVATKTVPASAAGTVTHLALVSSTELLYVTTTASTAVTSGANVGVDAWAAEIRAPV
ncbi:hypothetical protein FEA48_30770 [Pseudomonas nitroreducens]|uniref:Uncharacterized protein n=1 Tax=Pseudomonas nitroreducens TaxID=46680 RepID=A0A5R8ZRG2_PSENT|nr:hypothetical protein [Pseudomonas nitroreducens]TLP68239.1 hypothetical protein FEA48_30770 [Pseudomonas nitroreducens]